MESFNARVERGARRGRGGIDTAFGRAFEAI